MFYFETGIVRWATEQEEPMAMISPINVIRIKENKFQVIYHSLLNARYSQVDMKLMDVLQRGEVLRKATILHSEDLKSCYNQWALSPESVLMSGFRYNGKVAVYQCCEYGPSQNVFLINSLVNIAVEAIGERHGVKAEAYIDDIQGE